MSPPDSAWRKYNIILDVQWRRDIHLTAYTERQASHAKFQRPGIIFWVRGRRRAHGRNIANRLDCETLQHYMPMQMLCCLLNNDDGVLQLVGLPVYEECDRDGTNF